MAKCVNNLIPKANAKFRTALDAKNESTFATDKVRNETAKDLKT